jgi:hypothetical protein
MELLTGGSNRLIFHFDAELTGIFLLLGISILALIIAIMLDLSPGAVLDLKYFSAKGQLSVSGTPLWGFRQWLSDSFFTSAYPAGADMLPRLTIPAVQEQATGPANMVVMMHEERTLRSMAHGRPRIASLLIHEYTYHIGFEFSATPGIAEADRSGFHIRSCGC